MKKSLIFTLILIAGVAFSFSSCRGTGGISSQLSNPEAFTEGKWINGSTYWLTALGSPGKMGKGKSRVIRRNIARENARLEAVRQVLIKFKGEKAEAASGSSNYELTGVAIGAETKGFIKNGSVVKTWYDKDTDDCQLIYQVSAKGLKKKVRTFNVK